MNATDLTEAIATALREHDDIADATVIEPRTIGVEVTDGAQYFVTVDNV